MANAREIYRDTRDLIEDSLELLGGEDKPRVRATIWWRSALLADPVSETEAALAQRVARAPTSGASWLVIAEALASSVTEVRLRYYGPSCGPERSPRPNQRHDREEPAAMAVKLYGNGNKSYLQLDGDLELPEGKPRSRGK
jgi:hypothetical protein